MLPEDAMGTYRGRLDALERRDGGTLTKRTNQKPHLLYPWMAELFHYALMKDYGVARKKPAAHKQKHAPGKPPKAGPAKKARRPAVKKHR